MLKCLKCGSKNIAKYMYGLPIFSDELLKDIDNGKIKLGGCIVMEDAPNYHCNDCKEDFGCFRWDY